MWGGEVDLLAPVGAVGGGFAAEEVVAQEAGLFLHLDLEFLVLGEGEEGLSLFDDVVDERGIDAGVFDVEEAHVEEGIAEVVQECGFGLGVSG